MSERPNNGTHTIGLVVPAHEHARPSQLAERDALRRYLILRAEALRILRSTPERDAELVNLEGWIRWLRGAV